MSIMRSAGMDNLYTVILLRPRYLTKDGDDDLLGLKTDEPYGTDIYVGHVTATGYLRAIRVAQEEVFYADTKDGLRPRAAEDYALCVMFEGHQQPKLYGWQT